MLDSEFCFRLKEVLCLGVTAGAYILTLFAVSSSIRLPLFCIVFVPPIGHPDIDIIFSWTCQVKYKERVLGLILVSPICKAPSWTEWLYNKVLASITKSLASG